jgi:hypothetical protein
VLEFQAKETKTSTLVNNGKISKKMYSASIMDALYNVTVLGPEAKCVNSFPNVYWMHLSEFYPSIDLVGDIYKMFNFYL